MDYISTTQVNHTSKPSQRKAAQRRHYPTQNYSHRKDPKMQLTSSPVGKTVGDTVFGELVSVSSSENEVTLELGVDDLWERSKHQPFCPSSQIRLLLPKVLFPLQMNSVFTWQMISLLVKRTTSRYLGALYLFLAWDTNLRTETKKRNRTRPKFSFPSL